MGTLAVSAINFAELDFSDFAAVSNASTSQFSFNFTDGSRWDLSGAGFVYGGPNGLPTAGTITDIAFFEPGSVLAGTLAGVSLAASAFTGHVVALDEAAFIDELLDGNDTLLGGATSDDMRGAAGTDLLFGGGGSDTLGGDAGSDVIVGDFLGNSMTVSGGADLVYGGAATDYVVAGLGNDTLYGDAGGDWLEAGDDDDVLYGGTDDDAAIGGSGDDAIDAAAGNDYAAGGEGADAIAAGLGDDWADGGNGNDALYGGDGNDVLQGGGGRDLLDGGSGDDVIQGDGGFAVVAAGNDTLYGGTGQDLVQGGDGNDRIYGGTDQDLLAGGSGNDWLAGGTGNDLLQGEDGGDVVLGDAGIDLLFGGAGNDTLQGGSEADWLLGEAGDDQLDGGSGNDVLDGGAGSDTVIYAAGVVTLGSSGDTLTIDAGAQGIDILISVEQAAAPDTTPPSPPTITGFSQDTGTSGDFLTADATPTLSGTAEANALVTVFRDAVAVGTTSADEAGNWSFDSTALAVGTYAFTATASDLAGNTSAPSAALNLQISVSSIFDLTSLGAAQGFIIQGDTEGDLAGIGVASAGDINGDGYDDVIVGAYRGNDGGADAGEAYVVFGRADGFGAAVTTDGVVRQVIDLTSLASSLGFVIQGDATDDHIARSVSSAGDVNGDGFDDLIVGADGGDDGGTGAGEAYVVFGAAGGFGVAVTAGGVVRQVIDLTSLAAAQGFVVQGDVSFDNAGFGVSSAGDVNGDGYDDLIVGALFGADGGGSAGEAYVVFGAAGGFGVAITSSGVVRQVIDLTSLQSAGGFVIQGDASGDRTGGGVSSAGDVNGDGFDDLILGAQLGDDGGDNAGEAYVLLGTAGGFGVAVNVGDVVRQVIDLTSLELIHGFIIQGDSAGDYAGFSVATAGDVNGDGFDDLIVGARSGDDGGNAAGEAYVVFGAAGGFGVALTTDGVVRQVIDLTSLGAAQGFIVQGDTASDFAGGDVASAGDVNGDGFDDLIVGAARGDDGGDFAGEAYVVFGAAGGFGATVTTDGVARQVIDLASLTAAQGFIIQGDTVEDFAGVSVSAAGDVNGDGFDDLIVGAYSGDDGGADAGEAYVLFGAAFGAGAPVVQTGGAGADLLMGDRGDDTLDGGSGGGDILRGGAGNDLLRIGSPAFGDIDGGTGVDTLALTGGGQTIDLRTATPAELQSIEWFDLTGSGNNTLVLDRLAVFDATEERDGGAAIIHVEGNAGDTVRLIDGGWSLAGTIVDGGTTFERFLQGQAELRIEQGLQVEALAPLVDLGLLRGTQGFIIQGDATSDFTGASISSAGDVNGDGFDDLIVGAAGDDDGGAAAGAAYVVFGSSGGFGVAVTIAGLVRRVIDLTSLTSAQGFIIQGDTGLDGAGGSVSLAGDVNGDGFGDLIVGAASGKDGGNIAGEAYVVFGTGGGFGVAVTTAGVVRQVVDLTSLVSTQGFIIQGDTAGDLTGRGVSSAGDVNGDGFDDLIVGADGGGDGGVYAGETYVVFGASGGLGVAVTTAGVVRQVIDLTSLASAQGFIVQGDTAGDLAGRSVSSAGDVNGDGFDDVLIGARNGDDGGANAGEAYVVFGTAGGLGVAVTTSGVVRQVVDLTSLGSAWGFVIQGDTSDDKAGFAVSSAGDVNGDGFDDVIVGAAYGDDGGGYAGEAYVVFGAAAGFGVAVTLAGIVRQVVDLTSLGATQGFVIQGNATQDRAGGSVSSAGDVNGDGFDDLIVGASFGSAGGGYAGEAYVIFGTAGGFGVAVTTSGAVRQVVDLASLGPVQGFLVVGDTDADGAGIDVSSAGDINGDGFDDMIIGANGDDDGGNAAGAAYVLFGAAFGSGAPIVQSGGAGNDLLIGDHGADILDGGSAGADILRGGAGNDLLRIGTMAFADIDGGTGIDTLALLGSGDDVLDLRATAPAELQSIERVDLGGAGNDTLDLDEQGLFDLTGERGVGRPAVAVLGDVGDTVRIDIEAGETWTLVGSSALDGVVYNRYHWDADGAGGIASMANAELWLDQDLTLAFI